MDFQETIHQLNGALVEACTENAWGPSGALGVANFQIVGPNASFDLLVPTGPNDIWDYIWKSEIEQGSTDKVQLFQSGSAVRGSRVTAIAREGKDERWQAKAEQDRYRLTFGVPLASLRPDVPIEVRFFWSKNLMSKAMRAPHANR